MADLADQVDRTPGDSGRQHGDDDLSIAPSSTGRYVRCFLAAFAGLLLLQTAWILAVVPFRGLDEHEHVFKAAAVARGDLSPSHEASSTGWGEFMEVPSDLVVAAAPVCDTLAYTGPDSCTGRPTGDPDVTLAATSAARYHPAYYAVVGTMARPFTGLSALYVMRATSAVLCAALTALAISVLTRGGRSRTAGVAALVVLTPTFAYASIVVAPNGLEMAAAFLLWSCLLRLAVDPRLGSHSGKLVAMAGASAMVLVTLRTLGPLWCVVIATTCAVIAGRHRCVQLVRSRPVRVGSAVMLVGASTAAALAWSLAAGTNALQPDIDGFPGSPWQSAIGLWPTWLRQMVGAFPTRNEFAPPIVWMLVLPLFVVCLAPFFRTVRGRGLAAWTLLLVLVVMVPTVFTALTWSANGDIWQGRYGYAIAMGLALVAGASARGDGSSATGWPSLTWWLVPVAWATAQVFSLLGVLHRERVSAPGFSSLGVPAPSTLLLVGLCLASALLLSLGTLDLRLRTEASRSNVRPNGHRT